MAGLSHIDMDDELDGISPIKTVDLTKGKRGAFSLASPPRVGGGLGIERSTPPELPPDFESAGTNLAQRSVMFGDDPFDVLNDTLSKAKEQRQALEDSYAQQIAGVDKLKPDRSTTLMALAAGMLAPTKHGEFGEALSNSLSAALPYRQRYTDSKRDLELRRQTLGADKAKDMMGANLQIAGLEMPLARLKYELARQAAFEREAASLLGGGEGQEPMGLSPESAQSVDAPWAARQPGASAGPGGGFNPDMVRRMAMLKARGGPDLLSAYKAMHPEMDFQVGGGRLFGIDPQSGSIRLDVPLGMSASEAARDALGRAQYALEARKFTDTTGQPAPELPAPSGAPASAATAAPEQRSAPRQPPKVDFGGQPRQRPQAGPGEPTVKLMPGEETQPPAERRKILAKRAEARPAAIENVRSARRTAETVTSRIDSAVAALETAEIPRNAILRKLASLYPGSKTADMLANVETIKANLVKEAMDSFRAASSTGSTGFGALSEKELKVIASLVANLDTDTQSAGQIARNLKEIRERFTRLQGNMLGDYEKMYGSFPQSEEGAERKSRFRILR